MWGILRETSLKQFTNTFLLCVFCSAVEQKKKTIAKKWWAERRTMVITWCLIKQIYSNFYITFSYKTIYITHLQCMQHQVFIILVLTEFNSSIKCHLQDNIYNTVIYCNNWGLKFHKKRNKTALPLPKTWIDLSRLLKCHFLTSGLLIGNWISPSCTGASLWVYHFSRNHVYPSGCCLCQQLWQDRMS